LDPVIQVLVSTVLCITMLAWYVSEWRARRSKRPLGTEGPTDPPWWNAMVSHWAACMAAAFLCFALMGVARQTGKELLEIAFLFLAVGAAVAAVAALAFSIVPALRWLIRGHGAGRGDRPAGPHRRD
jgi:hypothetical protein